MLIFALLSGIAHAQIQPEPDECPNAQSGPYNIVLIVLDDVGTDKLNLYADLPTEPTCADCPTPAWNSASCPMDLTQLPYPYAPTPNIDAIASCGVLFTRAYANPVCSPSRAEILTGRYAFRTGMGSVAEAASVAGPSTPWEVRDCERFVSEMLKIPQVPGGPYQCGAFGKWHLTGNSPLDGGPGQPHPIRNGFDFYQGMWANPGESDDSDHFKWIKVTADGSSTTFQGYNVEVDPDTGELLCTNGPTCYPDCEEPECEPCLEPCETAPEYTVCNWDASVTREDAVDWISEQEGPFFAYVAFNPPHHPWQVPPFELLSANTEDLLTCPDMWESNPAPDPPNYDPRPIPAPGDRAEGDLNTHERRRFYYRAMLEAVDAEIGNLIQGLKDANKYDHTMIIVISDNGSVGGTRPTMDSPPHDTDHGKKTVYQLGTRVPLIVSGPLTTVTGTCDGLVGATDLWRTIGRIAGLTDQQITNYARVQDGPSPCIQIPQDQCAAVRKIDSFSFFPMVQSPSSSSGRLYAFSQVFTPNGEYSPDVSSGPLPYNYTSGPPTCTVGSTPYLTLHDRAITDGQWKVIVKLNPPSSYDEEVYLLDSDPWEQDDLWPAMQLDPLHVAWPYYNNLRSEMVTISGL